MIYEIRNYHFDPDRIDDYREWATHLAVPHLKRELDLVGFWINSADEPTITGAPHDDLGTANVTWIIRWEDVESRQQGWDRVFLSDAWKEIFERVPGGRASYRRLESKFADEI